MVKLEIPARRRDRYAVTDAALRLVGTHAEFKGLKMPMKGARAIWGIFVVASFLNACLISEAPLITNSAVYPFKTGTVVQQYEVSGGSMRPRINKKDGKIETDTLEIRNRFYAYVTPGAKGTDNFRLHQIRNSPFFVVMHQQSNRRGYFYALLEKKGDYYIHYNFNGKDFLRYKESVEKNAPERWVNYSAHNPWRLVEKNSISVSSLRLLEIILPEMAAGGFHQTDVTAYKVVGRGVAPRTAAGGASNPQASERERLEQACTGGNGAACFNLAVMVDKGDGGPQDKARSRALYRQACKQGFARGCEVEKIDARLDQLKQSRKQLEQRQKELCGGRVCRETADGRYIYRTETYKPPRWYFEDGRLAPRSEWPK